MSKIKQLLIMHRDGISNRSIARVLGMDKETVNTYVNKAKAIPEGLKRLLKLEGPELGRRLHSGNAAYSDPRFDDFREMLPYIEGELRRKGVTLRLLWKEYRAGHPEGYGLTQFRFHYWKKRSKTSHVSIFAKMPSSTASTTRPTESH